MVWFIKGGGKSQWVSWIGVNAGGGSCTFGSNQGSKNPTNTKGLQWQLPGSGMLVSEAVERDPLTHRKW